MTVNLSSDLVDNKDIVMETDSQAKKSEDLKKANAADYKKRDAIWPLVLFYINLYALGTYSIYVTLISASWTTIFFSKFDRSIGQRGP